MLKLGFTSNERRAVAGISSLYFLRIIGLFLLYPVLAIYAADLPHATPFLIGLALGVYGLAQATLQIPFGMLSDRFGRKPIIAIGLIIFALGSLLAASAEHIGILVAGRFLQGAGAISAVCAALIGDLVTPEHRSKAMACIGITIGAAFSVSLVLGPLIVVHMGLSGLFILLAGLAGMALLVLRYAIPTPAQSPGEALPSQSLRINSLRLVTQNRYIWSIAMSVGILHAALAALFMVVPPQIIELTGRPLVEHVMYYLAGIVLTFIIVFPLLGWVERRQWHQQGILIAIASLGVAALLLWQSQGSLVIFFTGLALFFLGFNFLEASLPALMTRVAPAQSRGAAMGFYSTCQFLGIFLGGIMGGIVLNYFTPTTLYFIWVWVIVLWLIQLKLIRKGG